LITIAKLSSSCIVLRSVVSLFLTMWNVQPILIWAVCFIIMLLLSCFWSKLFHVRKLKQSWFKIFMQIVIWFIIPATRNRRTDHNNNALALIVLLQYVPRLYLIFPLSLQIVKATGVVTKTAWAGAAYNLLLYMLASHVCTSVAFSFL
jgi:hypothetical protein